LSAMRKAALLFLPTLAAILLSPAVALACPYCAGNAKSGIGSAIVLTTFVLLPFPIVYAIYKFIRSEGQEADRGRPAEHALNVRGFGRLRSPFASHETRREAE
jgi:hypothetical protein